MGAEERGELFLGPGVEVYEGMVVGEHQRPSDLTVNVRKKRHVRNVRQSFKEIDNRLTSPREMSQDPCVEYLKDNELLGQTPTHLFFLVRATNHASGDDALRRWD